MKTFCTTLILLCLTVCISAQTLDNTITIEGRVQDFVTHVDVPGCLVEVLNANDSSVVASTKALEEYQNGEQSWKTSEYRITIPRKEGDYILRVTEDGFMPTYVKLPLRHFYKREISREVGTIFLKRPKTVDLKEVVVKATKVKFYHKGDTIVYNADAFQLGEGSMLDALIRQLPGAELSKDGRIYVNGKFVESLLLNGKDFFRGDNTVMFENLPTYMVNQVKVYDRLGENSRFLGQEVAGDKKYVMDVQLKKQYNIGWVGNVETGGGTKERYLARLFAMRFTDHSRLAVYGNMNNLNDDRKPGENDNWSPSDLFGGLTQQQLGGLDYNIDARSGKYKLSGNAQVKHADNTIVNNTNRTNFLANGDTYDRMVANNRNHNFTLSTDHQFYFEFKNANLNIKPRFNYQYYNNKSGYSSLTLNRSFTSFSKAQLDSLYTPMIGRELIRTAINRNLRNGLSIGHSLEGSVSMESLIKFKHSPDHITLYADASLRHANEDSFDRNRIDYYTNGLQSNTDFRNRYFNNRPDHGYSMTGKVTYSYLVKRGLFFDFSYKYNRTTLNRYSSLYRLDQLADWGINSEHELGILPSVNAYNRVMDIHNSYDSRQTDNTHTLGAFLVWNKKTTKSEWWAQLVPNLSLLSRTMHYHSGNVDTTFTKRSILYNMYSTFLRWRSTDHKYEFMFQYHVNGQAPDMNLFVNILNTTDPLNVTMGNTNLKPSYKHELISHFLRIYPKKGLMWLIEAQYIPTVNAIAMGYTYDKATGQRTFRPDNVNGNWRGQLALGGAGPLTKNRKLDFKAMAGLRYEKSVDLIGLAGTSASNRSIVESLNYVGDLQLNYRLGQSSIGFISKGNWAHVDGTREDFEAFNVSDFNYGLTAQLQLPWDFRLGTDLTMYSRRGYLDKSMNSDDLVWNARLSRSFFKGQFTLLLDGFDILGQLNNVTRTMNAQGITETYSNVIPRYVMLHAVYHFNIIPKKK